jgi:hypothetical protein
MSALVASYEDLELRRRAEDDEEFEDEGFTLDDEDEEDFDEDDDFEDDEDEEFGGDEDFDEDFDDEGLELDESEER